MDGDSAHTAALVSAHVLMSLYSDGDEFCLLYYVELVIFPLFRTGRMIIFTN